MFERMFTTKMSSDSDELRLRFIKIRAGSNKNAGIMSAVMSIVVLVTAICATIAASAMDTADYGSEYGGAMYTLYAYPQEDMEYNVNHVLGIYNEKYSDALLYPRLSSIRYGYNLFERYLTPLLSASLQNYYLIDDEGGMLDFYNRREPYYGVIKFWLPKDKSLNNQWERFEQTEFKTMTIGGKEVTVCFADNAVSYNDDPVLLEMIEKQILFELNYKAPEDEYSHYEYISEIIDKGVYVIRNVFPKESVQSYSCFGAHYGDFTEEAIIANNVNNNYLQSNRVNTFFNGRFSVPENIDGNQARKLCEVTVDSDECLILDTKQTTNKMPYINYKLVFKEARPAFSQFQEQPLYNADGGWQFRTAAAGEPAEILMMNVGGTRLNYMPSLNDDAISYEIWVSGPASDYADLDIYTCKLSDNMAQSQMNYMQIWHDLFEYDNPYGLIYIGGDNEIEFGS